MPLVVKTPSNNKKEHIPDTLLWKGSSQAGYRPLTEEHLKQPIARPTAK